MKVLLIRHGLTSGNIEKRYIGRTDEQLSPDGIVQLSANIFPRCDILICSPMRRCTETAELLFPGQPQIICPELKECDFGRFEGKNYLELSCDPEYQKWIDSGGKLTFPDGESPEHFRSRTVSAFISVLAEADEVDSVAFVVHGGTIMAVMERFAVPHRSYFDWHINNGHGYICEWDGEHITVGETI